MHLLLMSFLLLPTPDELSEKEFERIREQVHIRSKPWATLPWQSSVTQAREVAAGSGKPIFMMVDTGNPIGGV